MVNHDNHKWNKFLQDFLAGGISAATAKTAIAPIERVKLILQIQEENQMIPKDKKYKGIIDCFVRVSSEQGVLSFWRGNLVNLIRYFPLQALNFSFNNFYKHLFGADASDKESHFFKFFLCNLVSGGLAGGSSLAFVYPLDFARTRMAADISSNFKNREYKNFIVCLQKIYKTDGLKGIYRGLIVSFYGAIVYRAGYFGFYDTLSSYELDNGRNIIRMFFIAQIVSFISSLISYPFDLVSRKMMMMSGIPENEQIYKNTRDCWKQVYQIGGVKEFYRGALANAYRGFGGGFVLFLYPFVRRVMFGEDSEYLA